MKKILLSVVLSLFLFSNTAFATNYITSLYGGNLSSDDVVEFANEMAKISGWAKKTVDTKAYIKEAKDSGNSSTMLYWSGHGLPNGKVSCYGIDSQTEYIDYLDGPIMYSKIGSTIYYTPGAPIYSDSVWNGMLKYVVLAVCNQIGTDNTTTSYWKNTMYGSPNRVNMIFGYAGKGPGDWIDAHNDYRDDLIAKKFAQNMKNGMYIKDAWTSANRSYSISYSSVLYNDNSKYDKITSMTNITTSNNPSPVIYLEKNGTIQTFRLNNQTTALNTLSLENLEKTDVYIPGDIKNVKIDSVEESIIFDVEKYNNFRFDDTDIISSTKILTDCLKKNGDLPNNAELDSIDRRDVTLLEDGVTTSSEQKANKYIITYGQKIGDFRLSTLFDTNYISIYIENGKVYMIEKKWCNVKECNDQLKDIKEKPVSLSKAIKISNENLKKYYNADIPQISAYEIVYFKNNGGNIIPGWQINYSGLSTIIPAGE